MSGNSQGWFWTPERLVKLRRILNACSERDDHGRYFGAFSLSDQVFRNGTQEGLVVDLGQANNGLQILVFLGVLERGKPGRKKSGYKRRYYPARGAITDSDIQRYRAAHGVASATPPGR